MRCLKKIGFIALGMLGFLALLCSIAASGVVNAHWMEQGFLSYSDTAHLSVPATEYTHYAKAIAEYLDGKNDAILVPSSDNPQVMIPAFSEKENLHMQDVRGIVSFLKGMRWIGGGLVIAVIAGLYLFSSKEKKNSLLAQILEGFAWGAIALLGIIAALVVWGLINFDGLFWFFHQIAFTNDLWLLNPATDLLVALMPIEFFVWYASEMLKSLLPVLGMMLLLIIAWFKVGKKEA